MTMQVMGGALGTKAVTLSQFDEFLDYLVSGGDDGKEPQDLYKAVAWAFWCANLRADSVAQVPYSIYRMDTDEDVEENEVDFDIDLTVHLWAAEMWLCLKGAAYWLKKKNRVALLDLQTLNANTMKVQEYDADGPTVFRQTVGSVWQDYDAEEIVYFRTFNPRDDIGPGVASGQVATTAGGLVKSANDWATQFFEKGAIPAVILWTEGQVPDSEIERIRTAWDRLTAGVKKAFRTMVLRQGIKPEVIGQPIKDLAMPELETTKREQILAAHKIPPGLAEAKTNRAERDALQFEFWTQTIKPELRIHIRPAINKQLLNPLGLRIGFHTNQIESVQQAEIAKAESASFLVNGVMLPSYDANVVSIEETRRVISAILEWVDMPALDENFEPEERTPPQLEAFAQGPDTNEPEPGRPEPRGESPPKAIETELGKWRRMAVTRIKEGNPSKALEFISDDIPPDVHRMIVYGLERARTLGDIKDVFDAAMGEQKQARIIPSGASEPLPPIPNEIEITESDIDRALKSWDRLMPEFAGLLDADVIHKENWDNAESVGLG